MLNIRVQEKRRRGRPKKKRCHERVQDDERHGAELKCAAHEDKGRPITTWRRPIGEKTDNFTYQILREFLDLGTFRLAEVVKAVGTSAESQIKLLNRNLFCNFQMVCYSFDSNDARMKISRNHYRKIL